MLVTGAGGSIGRELCRQIARRGPAELVLLGHGENSIFEILLELREDFPELLLTPIIADVRDEARLEGVFAARQPEVIFHAAAHKHVPLMEANPLEAVTNNVIGTRNMVAMAAAAGVERFVMISTDKAVQPSSVYGAHQTPGGDAGAGWGAALQAALHGGALWERPRQPRLHHPAL